MIWPLMVRSQRFIRSTSDQVPDFPAHIASMDSTKSESSQSEPRMITCQFAQRGCTSAFTTLNDWNRHVQSHHLTKANEPLRFGGIPDAPDDEARTTFSPTEQFGGDNRLAHQIDTAGSVSQVEQNTSGPLSAPQSPLSPGVSTTRPKDKVSPAQGEVDYEECDLDNASRGDSANQLAANTLFLRHRGITYT